MPDTRDLEIHLSQAHPLSHTAQLRAHNILLMEQQRTPHLSTFVLLQSLARALQAASWA